MEEVTESPKESGDTRAYLHNLSKKDPITEHTPKPKPAPLTNSEMPT